MPVPSHPTIRKYENPNQFLAAEVLQYLDLKEFLPQLAPEVQGNYTRMACPKCKMRTAVWQKGSGQIKCPQEVGCGWNSPLLVAILYPEKVMGKAYRSLVRRMAASIGKTVPENVFSSKTPKKPESAGKAKHRKMKDMFAKYRVRKRNELESLGRQIIAQGKDLK